MRYVPIVVIAVLMGGLGVLSVSGPTILPCMGLGTTQVHCAILLNRGSHEWAPGPMPGAWVMFALPLTLLFLAVVPIRSIGPRDRAAIALAVVLGGLAGAALYELTRIRTMGGPVATGLWSGGTLTFRWATVELPANLDAAAVGSVLGGGVTAIAVALAVDRHHRTVA